MARVKSDGEKDQLEDANDIRSPVEDGRNKAPAPQPIKETQPVGVRTGSRKELMERIKRGERPTWVPSTNLKNLHMEEEAQERRQAPSIRTKDYQTKSLESSRLIEDPFFGHWTEGRASLDKPRSALHRGDFDGSVTPQTEQETALDTICTGSLTESFGKPSSSWLHMDPSLIVGSAAAEASPFQESTHMINGRRRAPSLGSSLSSSFVLRAPTSPLAHAVDNSDLEFIPRHSGRMFAGNDFNARRRTMPPNSFHSLHMSPTDSPPLNFNRPFSGSQRESSQFHNSHQPRRSLSSFTYQPTSSPSTPRPQARRLSLASDLSSRYHSSMVGSFEESIIRGRMSSPASQPFDFVAQIGVMGKGECPSSLKCPAHVSVPFQAVFYNYPSSSRVRSVSDDAPSPYVGTIDLENHLKPVLLSTKPKQSSTKSAMSSDPTAPENTPIGKALARDAERRKRKPDPQKIDLGGAYRIPQKGQLQIIIKNSNKTAVKLFLIPYDLDGMQAGTKTFIRQRSYSRGPIFDDTDPTGGIANLRDPLKDKHILRYLIHIWFCCPSEGRYYLHDHIRVVFANRVPDGREKLDNEIQLPDPRYSVFRSPQHVRKGSRSLSQSLAPVDSGISPIPTLSTDGNADETCMASSPMLIRTPTVSEQESGLSVRNQDFISIPLHFSSTIDHSFTSISGRKQGSHTSEMRLDHSPIIAPIDSPAPDLSRALSTVQGFHPSTSTRSSPIPWGSSSISSTARSFSPVPVEPGDGLLSRHFRSIYGSDITGLPVAQVSDRLSYNSSQTANDGSRPTVTEAFESEHDFQNKEEHSEQGDLSLTTTI